MRQNIWIINHYAGETVFDKGGRHYWFAKYLRKNGYHPVVFCSNVKHNPGTENWIDMGSALWKEKNADEIDTPYVFVKGRFYVGNGKSRFINMLDFYSKVKDAARQYANEHGKPDVIIASSVHPFALVAGIQLAKEYGVKCICEIRDLWPQSIIEYGIAGKSNPIVLFLRRLEKWAYKKADRIIFTMEGGYDYIMERRWERQIPRSKVFHINNGVDLDVFEENRDQHVIDDADLIDETVYKVVYTGSIRHVNNIGKIIDIAKNVNNEKVIFLIWGDGDEYEAIQKRIYEEKIKNVVLKGRVEKQFIPFITSNADLNFAHNSPSTLFKYGVSFNKIFDYLAAGKPILCDFAAKYNPVIEGGSGIAIESGDTEDIARQVDAFSMMNADELNEYKDGAKKAAQKYDYKKLTEQLLDIVNSLDKQ